MAQNNLVSKVYQFVVSKDKNEKFLHFSSFLDSSILSVISRGNYAIYSLDISGKEEKKIFDNLQPEYL